MAKKKPKAHCIHCAVSPWYHEPLETGRSYLVRQFDEIAIGMIAKKTEEPWWAHVQSIENGYAHCLCTDGQTRVLPTPALTYMVRTRVPGVDITAIR